VAEEKGYGGVYEVGFWSVGGAWDGAGVGASAGNSGEGYGDDCEEGFESVVGEDSLIVY